MVRKALDNESKDRARHEIRADTAERELKNLKSEHDKLQRKLEASKKELEDETLRRVDLENQLTSKEEHLKFENSVIRDLYYD